MRKLKLTIDRLAVESFPTVPEPAPAAGTVNGAEATARTHQCGSCVASCYTSCYGAMAADAPCTCPVYGTE